MPLIPCQHPMPYVMDVLKFWHFLWHVWLIRAFIICLNFYLPSMLHHVCKPIPSIRQQFNFNMPIHDSFPTNFKLHAATMLLMTVKIWNMHAVHCSVIFAVLGQSKVSLKMHSGIFQMPNMEKMHVYVRSHPMPIFNIQNACFSCPRILFDPWKTKHKHEKPLKSCTYLTLEYGPI